MVSIGCTRAPQCLTVPARSPPEDAEIAREVERAGLTGDQLGLVLASFVRVTRRLERTNAESIAALRAEVARDRDAPISPATIKVAARDLSGAAALHLARLSHGATLAAVALAFLAGAGTIGAIWATRPAPPVMTNVGPLDDVTARVVRLNGGLAGPVARGRDVPQNGGGRAVTITVWVEPPPAAP